MASDRSLQVFAGIEEGDRVVLNALWHLIGRYCVSLDANSLVWRAQRLMASDRSLPLINRYLFFFGFLVMHTRNLFACGERATQ